MGLQKLPFMPPQQESRILKLKPSPLWIHKTCFNILKHVTKCKKGGIQQSKNKQRADCPYKRAGKLILEFTVPGNRAASAKKRFWLILITASQMQAQRKPKFRFPMTAVGSCNKESLWLLLTCRLGKKQAVGFSQ